MRSLFSSSLHHLRPSLLPHPSRPPPLNHLLRFTTTSSSHRPVLSKAQRRRAERSSPSTLLRVALDQCSKRNDLSEALRLYDSARADSVPLSLHHYNVLLYLCSNGPKSSLNRGFDIFRQMGLDQIPPNEATFTNLARLAAAADDPNLAFDVVKRVPAPRLRSYGPALFGFCKRGDFDGAFEVDEHMLRSGVVAEEAELAALLGVSVEKGRGESVYRILHRLRAAVRRVEESTAGLCEGWFRSEAAEGVGEEGWDVGKVREGVVRGGGGWHGIGWLGKGRWRVGRAEVDRDGTCRCCGERLDCIDIDPSETKRFASSVSGLAFQREVQSDFTQFQEWLAHHGPFEAVVDGANVGYFNQYSFSFFQLNSVVNGIREMSPSKKLPLIILHKSRMRGGPADNPKVQKLLERWRRSGVLYTTPIGSNDDWYWLYAAVRCRCLLITNDEMRDHLFQLLGTSFFPRWKEKHQVRLRISKEGPVFHMPPPYSIVIQESEKGNWHIPTVSGDDIEQPIQWVCATRAAANTLESGSHEVQTNLDLTTAA